MTTTIQTPTPDLERTADFYARLGFTRRDAHTFTDGAVTIVVAPARTARVAVVLHGAPDVREALGRVVEHEGRWLASDPNGVWLCLDPSEAPEIPAGTGRSRVGTFAGLSIESLDPVRTVAFWEAAGWRPEKGDAAQGWVQLGREGCVGISVMGPNMCPHLFPNPGLTYFNSGKNLEVVAALREAGVPLAEEITLFNERGEVDNVVLVDPGGLGFFVFND
ncbi:MAG: hypothetical protein H6734_12460 [Alphaproteobacteria bacterium]|nr:hypothetical protein [Alphaproteobacteria bacterium]